MSTRLLLEVALRVLGLWFLFNSIVTVTTGATWYAASSISGTDFLLYSAMAGLVQVLIGVVLICWAPGITARFYPADDDEPDPLTHVGPGDVYHTACFVLGVYLLVRGVESAGWWVVRSLTPPGGWQTAGNVAVSAIVYTSSGLLLIFGARRIGELASSLGYDPESIPRQQFSLKLLLIITGVVAVVLGVIRMISVGGL